MTIDRNGLGSKAPAAWTAPPHHGPPRILVVDDDDVLREMESLILKREGLRVDTAGDGETAWQALSGGDYDLLVTDLVMPGISGVSLVRRLRVAYLALPVVMVSGTLETLDLARLSRDPWARIHAFVYKPFAISTLLSAVHSALASGTTSGPGVAASSTTDGETFKNVEDPSGKIAPTPILPRSPSPGHDEPPVQSR